ncbi:MAG: ABC transporter permease [Firmicutes bacterium]|nr:ABC transporter permease [Bacillota bacterium]
MEGRRPGTGVQLWLLLGPTLFWLIVFLVLPLILVAVISFATRGEYGDVVYRFNLHNYLRFLDPLYLEITVRSIWVALLTTLIALLIGYPFAYYVANADPRRRPLLLLLIIVPFWTNFLIRTYAWIVLLRTEGVINTFLQGLGLIHEPLSLLYNMGSVLLGLVYGYLPFMVLPIYASIEKLDPRLLEAAQDLGALPRQAFWRVTLPLTLPGIVAGSILTFVPALGMFVVPDLMGGAKTVLISNLIQNQFLTARNWPFGSAAAVVLMVLVVVSLVIYARASGFEGEEAR